MTERELTRWAQDVRRGRRSPAELVRAMRQPPIDHLGFARLDMHRTLRRGVPEAVYCEGKSIEQVIALARRLIHRQQLTLLTRMDASMAEAVVAAVPRLRYAPMARLAYWTPQRRMSRRGLAVVVTGGTADLPIAEEAALTLELLGSRVHRLFDVGVAGLHRVLAVVDVLQRARAVVVAAGMEGALASVVAGLVRAPVVAVPTSVGYGAHFGGIGPLLTMLNSCAPGIGVVNIDNGFGAGYLAHTINIR
jgi:NCAIR mutase (PurE)-related protein